MKFLKSCLVVGLAIIATSTAVFAKQIESHQTRASGPGIYRIELRNVGELRVTADGDSENNGELHSISIQLIEEENTRDRQFHTVIESAPMLRNTSTREPAGSGYLTIHPQDLLRLGQRTGAGTEDDYNLWIHSAYRRPAEGESLTFLIIVTSRELDCTGQRVCNRGNTGIATFEVKVPAFRADPPRDCTSENTFRLTTVDNWPAVFGNSNLVSEVGVRSTFKDYRTVIDTVAAVGPYLMIMNAEICIARTW